MPRKRDMPRQGKPIPPEVRLRIELTSYEGHLRKLIRKVENQGGPTENQREEILRLQSIVRRLKAGNLDAVMDGGHEG